MSDPWKLYWLMVVGTLELYFAMILWPIPTISASAGGLALFDMRPTGYTFDEAHAFLSAISDGGAAMYLGLQQNLDTAYPAFLAGTLGIGIWNLSKGMFPLFRWIMVSLPIIGSTADYLENAAVRKMLQVGADGLSETLVATANQWTLIKSGATSAGMVVLAGLLVMVLWKTLVRQNPAK